jgi:hypothetical protein
MPHSTTERTRNASIVFFGCEITLNAIGSDFDVKCDWPAAMLRSVAELPVSEFPLRFSLSQRGRT